MGKEPRQLAGLGMERLKPKERAQENLHITVKITTKQKQQLPWLTEEDEKAHNSCQGVQVQDQQRLSCFPAPLQRTPLKPQVSQRAPLKGLEGGPGD